MKLNLVSAVVATAMVAASASAQVKNWNVANGFWNAPGNWSPVGVPTPANFVNVGNTAPAENEFVSLNVSATILSLAITDGMTVMTGSSSLIVFGGLTMSGANDDGRNVWESALRVGDGPAPNDVVAASVALSDGAKLDLDGGTLNVADTLTLGADTLLVGTGTIILNGDDALAMLVDGLIGPSVGGITIIQNGDGRIDLDGNFAGDVINITTATLSEAGTLTIQGTGLTDAVDDDIWLSSGNQLVMDLDEGWALGIFATLKFGFSPNEGTSVLAGSHVTIDGAIESSNLDAHLLIAAPVTLSASASVDLPFNNLLDFDDTTTVNGGVYELGEDAIMRFGSSTSVNGGTFNTFSASFADGRIEFNGPIDYDGTISVNGAIRQNGNATVSGPTTIDAQGFDFDMDGLSGTAQWSIGNNLVINAKEIDEDNSTFDGDIEITGTFLGKLTVNLDDPTRSWGADGTLDLGGVGAIMTTRIAGNPVGLDGDVNITGAVQITADALVQFGCVVDFASTSARLRFAGETSVNDDSLFIGGGNLENAATGLMTLSQGTNLFTCDLLNAGTLRLGQDVPGLAMVDAVTFESTSTWVVDLGGASAGFQHDQLMASGAAQLNGTLDVRLIDLGGGVFEPDVGDAFTILTAPSTQLSGTFTNQPVSFIPGNVYVWSVSYVTGGGPNSAKLTVSDIIPCPGDLTGDGTTDAADLAILLGAWGPCPACVADIDLDGDVGGSDLAILLGAWGPCPLD